MDGKTENNYLDQLMNLVSSYSAWLAGDISENIGQKLAAALADFGQWENQNKQLAYQMEVLQRQIKQLGTNSQLLENANDTIKLLSSQHYDRYIIRPMVSSIFPVIDYLITATGKLEQDRSQPKVALKTLCAVQSQITQFLANYGIEYFRHPSESKFDPQLMEPVKRIFTSHKALDSLIAESLRVGFRAGPGQILRYESVSIFKYQTQKSMTERKVSL